MIKYTYDVELSQFTRQTRDKYAEEYQILKGLEGGGGTCCLSTEPTRMRNVHGVASVDLQSGLG